MGFSDVMKKAFPFISAAASLGGPIGVMAASVVGKAIGADKPPAGTADGISNAIANALASPEQRAALIKAEQDFQLQMAELGYKNAADLEATAAADRASARQMQVQVKSWIPASLAIFVTLGFFGILGVMCKYDLPVTSHDAMMLMLGSLATAWVSVISYYFGSSAGSAEKTRIMANGNAKPS